MAFAVVVDKDDEPKTFQLSDVGMEVISKCTLAGFHRHEDENGQEIETMFLEIPVTWVTRGKRASLIVYDVESIEMSSAETRVAIMDAQVASDAQPLKHVDKEQTDVSVTKPHMRAISYVRKLKASLEPLDGSPEVPQELLSAKARDNDVSIVSEAIAVLTDFETRASLNDAVLSLEDRGSLNEVFEAIVRQDERVYLIAKIHEWRVNRFKHIGFTHTPKFESILVALERVRAPVYLKRACALLTRSMQMPSWKEDMVNELREAYDCSAYVRACFDEHGYCTANSTFPHEAAMDNIPIIVALSTSLGTATSENALAFTKGATTSGFAWPLTKEIGHINKPTTKGKTKTLSTMIQKLYITPTKRGVSSSSLHSRSSDKRPSLSSLQDTPEADAANAPPADEPPEAAADAPPADEPPEAAADGAIVVHSMRKSSTMRLSKIKELAEFIIQLPRGILLPLHPSTY